MKIIHQLTDISDLDITSDEQQMLTAELIKAFSSAEATNQFWTDYGCFLIHLTHPDDAQNTDGISRDRIERIVNSPEYVTLIGTDEVFMLAMGIIDDAGAGDYLLMPLHQKGTYQHTLMQHVKLNYSSL